MLETVQAFENISLDLIIEPEKPMRANISEDSLITLIESIVKYGLIHPISVKKAGEKYKIIAGNRRYLAFVGMDEKTIPCNIMTSTDEQTFMRRYIENMERENINVIEEAHFITETMEQLGLKGYEMAEKIGRSSQYVSDRVSVMGYHEMLIIALKDERITFGVARELNRIDDEDTLAYYLSEAVKNGITANVAQHWQQSYRANARNEANEENSSSLPPAVKEKPYAVVTEKCSGCSQHEDITKMRRYSMCPNCVEILSNS